jgi:release factor glutamine methyltransferase
MHPARALPTHGELVGEAAARLAAAGIDTARLDAEVLLAFALGLSRSAVYARLSELAPAAVAMRLTELVDRRVRREPIAYITGVQEFWSLPFAVTPAVLIPRPETEQLVETVCELAQRWRAALLRGRSAPEVRSDVDDTRFSAAPQRYGHAEARPSSADREVAGISICDIGTGSGCVAVALARELPGARVVAVDISPDALAIARRNAATHGVRERISFVESDVFDALGTTRFDVVVSNPPYLRPGDRLCPEIGFEPPTALEAELHGLGIIRRLIAEAPHRLSPGGWLVMEIGADQADAVRAIATEHGLANVAIEHDLAGLPRVLVAQV